MFRRYRTRRELGAFVGRYHMWKWRNKCARLAAKAFRETLGFIPFKRR